MITISEASLEQVREACAKAYPEEACGMLLGRRGPDGVAVRGVAVGRNVAARRRAAYVLAPESFVAADAAAVTGGHELVGVFHSHPDGEPEPSATDARNAEPGWSYLILGTLAGTTTAARSFRLVRDGDDRRMVEEPVIVRRRGA